MGADHDQDFDEDQDDGGDERDRRRRLPTVIRGSAPPQRDDRRDRARRGGAPRDRDRRERSGPREGREAGRQRDPQATEDRLARIERQLEEQRVASESRERRIRSHADVTAAAEEARHRYHDIASKLRQAFVGYRAAYELQKATVAARQREIDAMRMAFIDLFFVGVAGVAGGVLQQVVQNGLLRRTQYTQVAAGTAAGDIAKYVAQLAGRQAGPSEPAQAPGSPQPAQAPATPRPAQAASPQPAQATQPARGQAPAGGPPQAATPQAPQGGAVEVEAGNPAADGGIEPISWIEGLIGRLDSASSQVSRALGQLAITLARGTELPADIEQPMAVVQRILQPIEALGTITILTQHQYGEVLWTRWIQQHWLPENMHPEMTIGPAHERLMMMQSRDAALLAQIRQQSGGSDRAFAPAIEARRQQALELSRRRAAEERENQARLFGVPRRDRTPRPAGGDPAQ